MDESEDNMSSEDLKSPDNSLNVRSKPKKRSLIERELETSLTSKITSPAGVSDGMSTSRYGRARRLKSEMEQTDPKKLTLEIKSPTSENSPTKTQSPVYKMHASNSPMRTESPKKVAVETFLDSQIESIYQENISLSRFGSEEVKATSPSPAKKFPKVYIRKDLIQTREPDDSPVTKNMFSPAKSGRKSSSTHLNNILERSSEKFTSMVTKQNGILDNSSVVKTLDFDSKKKKKDVKDIPKVLSKSDLFELEAKCPYQVGDLAWARMGTYPFWPSIVTRDPSNGIFVKKKLFGRIERDVIHVTFFGDNGRRGWIVDSMLRRYLGQLEFESSRENFTNEDKKKDPRLYQAFFVSDKKQPLWNASVEEAEMLLREPKRLRIDIFNDMLEKSRQRVKQQKGGKISRTDSDVSLSESLYDSLFSEDDGKSDNPERSRNRSRNKSLDVFEVVTACLDNMAAKTGITKIQRQSHMDRWLQKAKSKTPEKPQAKTIVPPMKIEEKKETKCNKSKKKKKFSTVPVNKPYSLRKSMTDSNTLLPFQNEHDYSKVQEITDSDQTSTDTDSCKTFASDDVNGIGNIPKVDNIANKENKKGKEKTDCRDSEIPKEIVKLNGITDSEESETVDDTSQETCPTTSTTDNITEEDKMENSTIESSDKNLTEDSEASSQDMIQSTPKEIKKKILNNIEDSDEIPSPVYEDLDDIQEFKKLLQKTAIENKKAENEIVNSPEEFTNDSTIASETTANDISAEDVDDSDYKPNYTTESDVTADNMSLDASISNSTAEDIVQYNTLGKGKKKPEARPRENGMYEYKYQENRKNKDKKRKSLSRRKTNSSIESTDNSSSNIIENGYDSVSSTRTGSRRKLRSRTSKENFDDSNSIDSPAFLKYLEIRQDAIMDENPDLGEEEIVAYLYKAWLYEKGITTDVKAGVNEEDEDATTNENEISCKKLNFSDDAMDVDNITSSEIFENRHMSDNVQEKERTQAIQSKQADVTKNITGTQEMEITKVDIIGHSIDNLEKHNNQVDFTNRLGSEEIQINQEVVNKLMINADQDVPNNKEDITNVNEKTEPETNLLDNVEVRKASTKINDIVSSDSKEIQIDKVTEQKSTNSQDIQNNKLDIQESTEFSDTINKKNMEINKIDTIDVVKESSQEIHKNKLDITDNTSVPNKTQSDNEISNSDIVETNKVPIKNIINEIPTDKLVDDVICNTVINGHVNIKEVDISTAKEVHLPIAVPETIKENGFHEEDTDSQSTNRDIDLYAVSIHSEDSVTSTKSESRRKLRSRNKISENPLKNVEFVKYLEMRQDAVMDENPELSHDEIVSYLYKTWLYEESSKSDDKKNDDLREFNLVKGLNMDPVVKIRRMQNSDQIKPKPQTKKNLSINKKAESNKLSSKSSMEKFLFKKKIEESSKMDVDEQSSDIESPEMKLHEKNVEEKETSNKEVETLTEGKPPKEIITKESSETPIKEQDKSQSTETEISLGTTQNEESMQVETSKSLEVKQNDTKKFTATDENKTEPNKETLPINPSNVTKVDFPRENEKTTFNEDFDGDSMDSEDSEAPLIKLRSRSRRENGSKEDSIPKRLKEEEVDTISINSEDSEVSLTRRRKKLPPKNLESALEDPEFIKYLELRQDALIDENPQLTQDEIVGYLYQTWLYEESTKSEIKKTDEIEQSGLVKGLQDGVQQPKKIKRKVKTEKELNEDVVPKEKPRRKAIKPFYNEEYSDIEEELEVFEIFKPKNKQIRKSPETTGETSQAQENEQSNEEEISEVYDEVELYFEELTKPKPNIFKGLAREKVCEICEKTGHLVKCKGCHGMFHVDCVSKEIVKVEAPTPTRGRKKKKKVGRRPKNPEDPENHDEKSQDVSEENNASIEEIIESESHTVVDAITLESQLEAKMKEILENSEKIEDYSYSSDECLDWNETVPGKCEIIDIKLKPRTSNTEADYSNFKCKNCQNHDTPVCFVCKLAVSKNESTKRQKCHVAHCHKYYHLECLDHWPQTQFNGGEPSKNNKKIDEYFEALTCPRHVCHTCVSDDPRGCKTRFSGDKLARCVRCPATYHSFTKCLPAGSQILTASHIICPRHYEHKPGKVPCHVNTGWCFICALGGSLICCEYCPTSFHAECLNIKPPEGGYMCEDCETGRLPLYGEMVWVKLGHYRWWPGIILHPSEIPENILAVKHNLGEFVVRFFGQYDHYWVNRGRVFPFQEGDSGRISSQKSKIDAAFTMAMEHAQRAYEILKTAQLNEEESLDIASSLLPPHYVKLKVNKPCGSLCGRRVEDPESSLTQCECNPNDEDPCGPYSQCLNRMLLTECGPTCRAGDRCNNRAFEKRLYPKLTPYRTPSRGWGLKTLEDIKAGQFVIEYVGELIDEEEFRRRMRRKHEIRDENFYFLTLDKERMIDAGPKGNLARFMNHCCEPNCETQKWTVLGDVRVGLFALYDIPANSEVTFNYNLECAGIEKKRCMCGAKRCAGYIGAKPKQDESQSKKPKRTYKKRKPTEESPSTKNKPKRPIGRPPKPKELSEIEKDLLIIRNATNGLSSDESSRSMSSEYERNPKALKRKRVSFSTEEVILYDGSESPSVKKQKLEEKSDIGD